MTRRPRPLAAALLVAFAAAAVPGAGRAEAPDPAKVISAADLAEVLGGTWTTSSPEPGFLSCEQTDGYSIVQVYLYPANGKTVAEMLPGHRENGETVDEVPGLGDAAMYRPQYGEATVEKRVESGETLWLSIAVHNVEDAGQRKELAIELARRAAARL